MKRSGEPDTKPPQPSLDATVDAQALPPGFDATKAAAQAEPAPRLVIADRYEILGLSGSGGMGTVYRALDRELDDVVSLKMLKKQIAAAPGILDRFRREVKLARRVTHRNVARTFDIGEHAGAKFLTMEFIDGEMLGAMVQRRGRLRVTDVVRIGRDICAGLSAAHAADVLHRDLKPANVIVARDQRAVITDFGIARALDVGASSQTAGGVVGTPAYMAPEQLEGAADLDARTDVYALGAMLFELLAGDVPWATLSPLQASLAKLQGPPPDLRALRPTLPDSVVDLVARCMARRRDDRFASAEAVAAALEALDTLRESSPSLVPAARPAPARHVVRTRLGVLPIVNEGDPANAYLAHKLTEDLVDVLTAVPGLQVRPLLAASPVPSEVEAVVNGTVHVAGDRLHVAVRLVMQEDGFALWEGRFDRSVQEIVAVADAAASAMADALTTKVLATPRSVPTNPAVYDIYLRGRHAFLRGWYDAGGEALRLLADAHMLAPSDATIAATYARALARAYGTGAASEDVMRLAKEVAEKALVLDPRRVDARIALASVHLCRGDGAGAAFELRHAYAIGSDDADVLEMIGRMRAEVGPLSLAAEQLGAALVRQPSSVEARYSLARVHALRGDVVECERTLGAAPAAPSAHVAYFLTAARLAMWSPDRRRHDVLLASLERLSTDADAKQLCTSLMGIRDRGPLSAHERELLASKFPSGAATGQRLAAFHAQIRAEVHLAPGDVDAAIDAIREADANALLDRMWLEDCPLLAAVRGHRDLEPVRRSTSLRASRVSDVLDSK